MKGHLYEGVMRPILIGIYHSERREHSRYLIQVSHGHLDADGEERHPHWHLVNSQFIHMIAVLTVAKREQQFAVNLFLHHDTAIGEEVNQLCIEHTLQ